MSNLTLIGQGQDKTILSGDIGVLGDNTDNTRHVVTVLAAGSGLTLKNMTIADGYSDLPNLDDGMSPTGQGAGLYVANANLALNQVTLRNNTLNNVTPPSPYDYQFPGGAGLFARGSNVVIKNSLITNNQAVNGAGFLAVGAKSTTTLTLNHSSDTLANKGHNGSLVIKNTVIQNNTAINLSAGGGRLDWMIWNLLILNFHIMLFLKDLQLVSLDEIIFK